MSLVENLPRRLQANTVLPQYLTVLFVIKMKTHRRYNPYTMGDPLPDSTRLTAMAAGK